MAEFGAALIVSGVATAVGAAWASAVDDSEVAFLWFYVAAAAFIVLGLAACVMPSLPARLPETREMSTSVTTTAPDPEEVKLTTVVETSYEVIGYQYATAGSLEAQLLGLLVAIGAGLGALALVHFRREWILLVGSGVALVAGLFALYILPELASGRRPRLLYVESGTGPPKDYLDAVSKNLDRAIQQNRFAISMRRGALGIPVVIVIGSIAIWALFRFAVR